MVELPAELSRFVIEDWVSAETFVPSSAGLDESELVWDVYSVGIHRRLAAFVKWSKETGIPMGRAGVDGAPFHRIRYPVFDDADAFFVVLASRGIRPAS